MLEARSNIGGCSATVEALGARVNICNCDHIMVRSTPVAEELDLERHGLRYLEADPAQLALSWNGDAPWFLFHDAERTIESLELSHPSEVAPYRRYLKAALPAARLVIELANVLPTPLHVASTLVRRRAAGVRTLLSWGRRSLDDVLRSYFANIPSVIDASMRLTTGEHVLSLEALFTPYGLLPLTAVLGRERDLTRYEDRDLRPLRHRSGDVPGRWRVGSSRSECRLRRRPGASPLRRSRPRERPSDLPVGAQVHRAQSPRR